MHDGMPYGRNQGQGQGHSREVDRQSPTGLIFSILPYCEGVPLLAMLKSVTIYIYIFTTNESDDTENHQTFYTQFLQRKFGSFAALYAQIITSRIAENHVTQWGSRCLRRH